MANVPVNQGCARIQATTSCPSAASSRIGSKSPAESKVPRLLTNRTRYPRDAYIFAATSEKAHPRPYGPRTSSVPVTSPAGS